MPFVCQSSRGIDFYMNEKIKDYLKEIGRKGGLKSKRVLTPNQAIKMVEAREAKRKLKNK